MLGIAYSWEENEADPVAAIDLVAKMSAGGFDLLLPALDAVHLDDFFQECVDGKTPPVEIIFADEDGIFFGMIETKSFVEFSEPLNGQRAAVLAAWQAHPFHVVLRGPAVG